MKKINLLFCLLFSLAVAYAQPVKFNFYNSIPVLKYGSTDTLLYPFTGGLNAPQFCPVDLDGDSKLDLFVFDRGGNKILTFLNKNNKYVYAPKYESMFPELTNWVELRDYDNDGKMDIFTEVNYNVQPEPNKIVYNNGIRVIHNISAKLGEFKWQQTLNQLYDTGTAFSPPGNLAPLNSDIPCIEDLDGDGDLDLLIMPLGKNVISYYQNVSVERGFKTDSLLFVFRDECFGYAAYKVLVNEFILGDSSACSRNYKKAAMHNGTTLCVFDKDNDGDKDVLYGDISFNSLVLLENGKTKNSQGRDSFISQVVNFPLNSKPISYIFPAVYMLDADFDGKKDIIASTNADVGSKNNNQISLYKNTGTNAVPIFQFQRENFLIDEMIDLGGGTFPNFVDIDGDSDLDMVISTQGEFTQTQNSNDFLVLYKNIGSASKPLFQLSDTNFLNINAATTKINRIITTFGDLNGDGKPDMIIGDLNGKIHYYQNTSTGSTISFNKISDDYFSIFAGTSAAPQLFDLNKDGKLDLILGRKNGTLAYFENSGSATAPNFTATASIDSIGKFTVAESVMSNGNLYYFDGYSIPHVCDLDHDGKFEILVGSEQGRVFLFNNFEANPNRVCAEITKIFFDDITSTPADLLFGNRTAISSADLYNDGKTELFIGNIRGGIRAYQANVSGPISSVKEQVLSSEMIQLFPNPATESISVLSAFNLKGTHYAIFNLLGEEMQKGVFEGYVNPIQIASLQPGVYFLVSADNLGHRFNSKFVGCSK